MKNSIAKQLESVLDPEINISIMDLGLVYDITVGENNKTHILMTLTTMGCPLFNVIEEEIYLKLMDIGLDRKDVTIEMTFDPPWDMNRLTPRGKALLGI